MIKKHEDLGTKHFSDSQAFIKYLNDMNDICKNNVEYNLNEKRKILIAFIDMIADMLNNKKLNPIATYFLVVENLTFLLFLLHNLILLYQKILD